MSARQRIFVLKWWKRFVAQVNDFSEVLLFELREQNSTKGHVFRYSLRLISIHHF